MPDKRRDDKRRTSDGDGHSSKERERPVYPAEGRDDGNENQPGENRELQHQIYHEHDQQSQ